MIAKRYTDREIALLRDFASTQAATHKVHRLLATVEACAAERDAAHELVAASWDVIKAAGRKDWTNESPEWRAKAEGWCAQYQAYTKKRKEAQA